jgi:hypothetical protein
VPRRRAYDGDSNVATSKGETTYSLIPTLHFHQRSSISLQQDLEKDVPKNDSPATAPLRPIPRTNGRGGRARRTAIVPPVDAPRRASAQVAVVTRRGESGSIVSVCIVGLENKKGRRVREEKVNQLVESQ